MPSSRREKAVQKLKHASPKQQDSESESNDEKGGRDRAIIRNVQISGQRMNRFSSFMEKRMPLARVPSLTPSYWLNMAKSQLNRLGFRQRSQSRGDSRARSKSKSKTRRTNSKGPKKLKKKRATKLKKARRTKTAVREIKAGEETSEETVVEIGKKPRKKPTRKYRKKKVKPVETEANSGSDTEEDY